MIFGSVFGLFSEKATKPVKSARFSFEALTKPNAANRRAKAHQLFMKGDVTSADLIRHMRTVTPSKVISELRPHYQELGVKMTSEPHKNENGVRFVRYWLAPADREKLRAR